MTHSIFKNDGEYITLENGLKVHYQQSGHGPLPVLFVPGWTMTTEVFHLQLEYFKDSDQYKFITLDPRSHGFTTQTTEGNHYEQHARDLHEFICEMGLRNIVLCGWSFGTLETLSYVNQFGTDKLSGFIMLDGPPRSTSTDCRENWSTYTYDDQDGSQEFFTMGKLRDPTTTNIEFARWMLEDKIQTAIDWIVSMTVQTPNEVASLLNASAQFLNFEQDLISLGEKLPIWCIVREAQKANVTNWCAKQLPNAHISAFGEHMMFWERPRQFNAELTTFLEMCARRQ